MKSSIARELQERGEGVWMNLGADVWAAATPARLLPGIGLRPGGEAPALEALVPALFAGLYESVAAHSRLGLHVVVDVGHHEGYATPRHTLADAARRLAGLPAWLVGVRCPLDVIMARRDAAAAGAAGAAGAYPAAATYLTSGPDGAVPPPVRRWQEAVHDPAAYDLELDTSVLAPGAAADAVLGRIAAGPPPTALRRLAATLRPGPPG